VTKTTDTVEFVHDQETEKGNAGRDLDYFYFILQNIISFHIDVWTSHFMNETKRHWAQLDLHSV
jgi:hypothetical protein